MAEPHGLMGISDSIVVGVEDNGDGGRQRCKISEFKYDYFSLLSSCVRDEQTVAPVPTLARASSSSWPSATAGQTRRGRDDRAVRGRRAASPAARGGKEIMNNIGKIKISSNDAYELNRTILKKKTETNLAMVQNSDLQMKLQIYNSDVVRKQTCMQMKLQPDCRSHKKKSKTVQAGAVPTHSNSPLSFFFSFAIDN